MVVAFTDSLGSVDNYDGGGYLISYFINGQLVPGGLAARAELYSIYGSPRTYIKQNKPLARSLYEEDFIRRPEVERVFIRGYLETFDLLIPTDTLPLRIELERYVHYPDLTESDLRSIYRLYSGINKSKEARVYENQAFQQFPNGTWALTQSSLLPGVQLPGTMDNKKRLEIYKQYKKLYDHPYDNESTQEQMRNRKGDFLSYLVEIYAKGDSLSAWEKEMNSMDYSSRCHTYQRAAIQLLAEDQGAGIASKRLLSKMKEPSNEHPFFTFQVMDDDFRSILAEKLSRRAVELCRANLNAPPRI